jgi:hypothetical protein
MQHLRGPCLVAVTAVAVEGHSDQFDVGHCARPSMIRALSSLPVNSTPRPPSMITPRT